MRQRSMHEAPVDIPEIPATVGPGEEVDWPHPIAGFEPVVDAPAPEPVEPAKPARKKAAPAAAPTGEEPKQ